MVVLVKLVVVFIIVGLGSLCLRIILNQLCFFLFSKIPFFKENLSFFNFLKKFRFFFILSRCRRFFLIFTLIPIADPMTLTVLSVVASCVAYGWLARVLHPKFPVFEHIKPEHFPEYFPTDPARFAVLEGLIQKNVHANFLEISKSLEFKNLFANWSKVGSTDAEADSNFVETSCQVNSLSRKLVMERLPVDQLNAGEIETCSYLVSEDIRTFLVYYEEHEV